MKRLLITLLVAASVVTAKAQEPSKIQVDSMEKKVKSEVAEFISVVQKKYSSKWEASSWSDRESELTLDYPFSARQSQILLWKYKDGTMDLHIWIDDQNSPYIFDLTDVGANGLGEPQDTTLMNKGRIEGYASESCCDLYIYTMWSNAKKYKYLNLYYIWLKRCEEIEKRT